MATAILYIRKNGPVRCLSGLLLYLTLALTSWSANGQQDAQYTQYMFNTQLVNPAYVGSRGVYTLAALYRDQWLGITGAPRTYNVAGNMPVGERLGVGASLYRDVIGVSVEDYFTGAVSYGLPLDNNRTYLFLGLQAGANVLSIDYDNLNPNNPFDSAFSDLQNFEAQISPILGAGAYLRQDDRWYIGFSVPNFIQSQHESTEDALESQRELINFYLIGGYVLPIHEDLKFKPAGLIKAVSGAPIAVDLSASFLYKQKFIMGAAWRLDSAISGLLGYHISEQLMIGYAYDYDLTELNTVSKGSHEVFVRVEFAQFKKRKIKSCKCFY